MEVPFIEQDCTFTFEGKTFESGGSWVALCSDGYMRGVVYEPSSIGDRQGHGAVTTWRGEKIANAYYGPIYQGNFCRMRSVTFTLNGVKYHGRYCPDWSQAIRVRSTKRVNS